MRTIKFRGRGVEGSYKGVWGYGDLDRQNMWRKGFCTIWLEDKFYGSGFSVDPETVGQFTGLFDKNGTEIYEGDIIESGKGIRHLVRFCPEQGRFDCTLTRYVGDQDFDRTERCELSQRWIDEFGKTVIGNIYDNPELIKRH